MDLFKEIEKHLTTLHPRIQLGDARLKTIKFTPFPPKNPPAHPPPEISIQIPPSMNSDPKNKNFTVAIKKTVKKTTPKKRTKKSNQIETIFKIVNKSPKIQIPQKRQREALCPCCQWIFPEDYTEEEMGNHVNLCIEGEGANHIAQYRKALKDLKKENKKNKRTKKTEQTREIVAIDSELSDVLEEEKLNVQVSDILNCQFCNICLNDRHPEFIKIHKVRCAVEQEEFLQSFKTTSILQLRDKYQSL